MKKTVLTFGILAGLVIAVTTAILTPLVCLGTVQIEHSEVLGYTVMVLAFLLVFFGIRSYRDNVAGGTIGFGKAFKVGILITLVACAFYVVSWEIVYYGFLPDFADRYAERVVEGMRQKGAPAAELDAKTKEMARFREIYKNPFVNVGMTFLEVFPVGLLVTLVSAAALRRKAPRETPAAPAAATP